MSIYLPYNYDESKEYNVLYLLHGTEGDVSEANLIATRDHRAFAGLSRGSMTAEPDLCAGLNLRDLAIMHGDYRTSIFQPCYELFYLFPALFIFIIFNSA